MRLSYVERSIAIALMWCGDTANEVRGAENSKFAPINQVIFYPLPPMGWEDFDGPLGLWLNPRVAGAAAGKYKGMNDALLNNGQTQVAVCRNIRNGMDWMPHSGHPEHMTQERALIQRNRVLSVPSNGFHEGWPWTAS